MKYLTIAAAISTLSATAAFAFPEDFGLPRFVQVDHWPDARIFDRAPTGSIRHTDCGTGQKAERHCGAPDDKAVGKQAPRY
jgi:hypothetical protein